MQLRSVGDGTLVAEAAVKRGSSIRALRFQRDGTMLASVDREGTVRPWSVEGLPPLDAAAKCSGTGELLALSADLSRCAKGGSPPDPATITNPTDRQAPQLQAGGTWLLALDFTPDGRTLLTGNQGVESRCDAVV